ncbi:hypothetical protein FKM82_003909, partial [Ascaphus truei]
GLAERDTLGLAAALHGDPAGSRADMWQPATERLQHFQTMLKSKLNVLTLRKEPLPAVIYHQPDDIELCTTTPLMKSRPHAGCKVLNLYMQGPPFIQHHLICREVCLSSWDTA